MPAGPLAPALLWPIKPSPKPPTPIPENRASAAKRQQRATAPVLKRRRSRRSLVGRARDRVGSLGYSLKRARLQTVLSLLEYPYSLFCTGGTQPHIVMAPPHPKNCYLPGKGRVP